MNKNTHASTHQNTFQSYRLELEQAAERWFRAKNLPVEPKRPYIPIKQRGKWPNLLNAEVVQEVQRQRQKATQSGSGFALHTWVHHGLSSQAMLFNLVAPLMARGDLVAMRQAFVDAGAPWHSSHGNLTAMEARFEVEDRQVFSEQQPQPTSIDLVIAAQDKGASPGLYIEAKLVEREFGGCSQPRKHKCSGANPLHAKNTPATQCHLAQIGRTYWDHLKQLGCWTTPLFQQAACPLAAHYQFFREVAFAMANDGHFILLTDARNPRFFYRDSRGVDRGIWPTLLAALPPAVRDRCHFVSIEAVVVAIAATGRHKDWIDDFAEKYAIVPPSQRPQQQTQHVPPSHPTANNGDAPMAHDVLLDTVKTYLRHSRLRLPSQVDWQLKRDANAMDVVEVRMSHDDLCQNMQTNRAAAPAFAICVAFGHTTQSLWSMSKGRARWRRASPACWAWARASRPQTRRKGLIRAL